MPEDNRKATSTQQQQDQRSSMSSAPKTKTGGLSKKAKLAIVIIIGLLIVVFVNSFNKGESKETNSTQPANSQAETEKQPTETNSEAQSQAEAAPATMPSYTGKNLSWVQTDVYKLLNAESAETNIMTANDVNPEHDSARTIIVYSNWKVCSQEPAAGTTVKKGDYINFGVVKTNEICP